VRDSNSIRMRSLQLERIKRDAYTLRPKETSREAEIRFAEVKEDFESLQKLESAVVKAYTTGVKINYERIRDSASEMAKKATRLSVNLFETSPDANLQQSTQNLARKSVRDLIIQLDRKLAEFVNSPMFKNHVVVDTAENAKAEASLNGLINLSTALSVAAARATKTAR
jgi:hypothetical protein